MSANTPKITAASLVNSPAASGISPQLEADEAGLPTTCSECNGSGEVCFAVHHPDDPRADRFAECDHCGGSGEIDEPTWDEFTAPFKRLADGYLRTEL